jgi:choloylglycine hydrolase
MNEKGLVANLLYLAESDYGTPAAARPNLSIGGWAQYVLDSFATVDEAVAALEKEPFTIVAPVLPNGEPGVGHLAISDPSGDSAIFEYIGGRMKIHHGRDYTVMTNSARSGRVTGLCGRVSTSMPFPRPSSAPRRSRRSSA